jgi:plasmid replication initiation protein
MSYNNGRVIKMAGGELKITAALLREQYGDYFDNRVITMADGELLWQYGNNDMVVKIK